MVQRTADGGRRKVKEWSRRQDRENQPLCFLKCATGQKAMITDNATCMVPYRDDIHQASRDLYEA